ncbi:sensor histidine kinase [Kangiella profundi]|uniref:histidine kinase n=1 Tax=Kangiella profundi TaxID=1561924 RepID=A0A2K9AXA3_9GAMM|nr:HAMP domain-containing sensor histidine kinase [Kangiella profundi]AUD79761.1 sensor histidine kinase [Kangiella profundi]GGE95589.1 sensor histidine kinase [Kangiella profundi]
MTQKRRGIHYKIIKAMAIQLLLISAVTLLGVYGAAKVVENVLIKQALEGEADFFWKNYEQDPNFNLPSTLNLTGYMSSSQPSDDVPDYLESLQPGYQRVDFNNRQPLVHISEQYGKRLYLVFEEGQVARLSFYFGIAPLAFVLLIIYLPAWITYMLSRRAISPVVKLSRLMDSVEVSERADLKMDFSDIENNADAEVMTLLQAFDQYAERVNEYVTREKNFTRYASHELRTPLAVLKGSISLLEKQQLNDSQQKIVSRMKPMVKEMEDLLEALFLLSRDQEPDIGEEPVNVNGIVKQQLSAIERLFPDKNIETHLHSNVQLQMRISERLLVICLNNIIFNAFNYTEQGSIQVFVGRSFIRVSDTGIGMDEKSLQRIFEPFYRANREQEQVKGFGLGMAIVKRICDQMDWRISIDSQPGKGTQIQLTLKEHAK